LNVVTESRGKIPDMVRESMGISFLRWSGNPASADIHS